MKHSNMSGGVVLLQKVDEDKKRQARELRRQQTPAERILWERVRRTNICGLKFRRQQIIEGFIVDFYCHKAGLVVEIDGDVHDMPKQQKIDIHRKEVFEARRLAELRFRNEDVIEKTDEVVSKLRRYVEEKIRKP